MSVGELSPLTVAVHQLRNDVEVTPGKLAVRGQHEGRTAHEGFPELICQPARLRSSNPMSVEVGGEWAVGLGRIPGTRDPHNAVPRVVRVASIS